MRCFAKSLRARFFVARLSTVLALAPCSPAGAELPAADGYRGIWYSNQRLTNAYEFIYSGGLATYPQQHVPIAIYSARTNKTFFVYGGTTARSNGAGFSKKRSVVGRSSFIVAANIPAE